MTASLSCVLMRKRRSAGRVFPTAQKNLSQHPCFRTVHTVHRLKTPKLRGNSPGGVRADHGVVDVLELEVDQNGSEHDEAGTRDEDRFHVLRDQSGRAARGKNTRLRVRPRRESSRRVKACMYAGRARYRDDTRRTRSSNNDNNGDYYTRARAT